MSKPVEFSTFYKLLNAVVQGDADKDQELASMLDEYKTSQNSLSPLHELGQIFLNVGIEELYNFVDNKDLQFIGRLTKLDWEELQEKNKAEQ